jgi:hypothetical protein
MAESLNIRTGVARLQNRIEARSSVNIKTETRSEVVGTSMRIRKKELMEKIDKQGVSGVDL